MDMGYGKVKWTHHLRGIVDDECQLGINSERVMITGTNYRKRIRGENRYYMKKVGQTVLEFQKHQDRGFDDRKVKLQFENAECRTNFMKAMAQQELDIFHHESPSRPQAPSRTNGGV